MGLSDLTMKHLEGGRIQVGSGDAQLLGAPPKPLDDSAFQLPRGREGHRAVHPVCEARQPVALRGEAQQRWQHLTAT